MARKIIVKSERIGAVLTGVLRLAARHNAKVVKKHMKLWPFEFEAAAIDAYPSFLNVKSGRLRGAIRGFSKVSAQRYILGLRVRGLAYATILHEGGTTRPHMIRPRKKGGTLSWIGAGGVRRFSKGHMHPGSKFRPRPYLRKPMFKESKKLTVRLVKDIGWGG